MALLNIHIYHYDNKRRLKTVVKNGATVEGYDFDANGGLSKKTTPVGEVVSQKILFKQPLSFIAKRAQVVY